MTKSYDPEGNAGIDGVQEEFRDETKGNDMADELVATDEFIAELRESVRDRKMPIRLSVREVRALLARLSRPVAVTVAQLQAAHIERQEEWCPEQKPDLSFRGNEMAGEVGEACNVIKKLERERHGWRGSRATKEQLAEELADVVHTATLCAITADINLGPAVVAKFNATSEKNGLATRITLTHPSPQGGAEPAIQYRNEEAGFVEFVNEDRPYIVREIDGRVAIILDMETRNVIGYRVYDTHPIGETGGPADAVSEAEVPERASEKFKLWFFRDIVSEQRLALFSLFGMPVDEISNHGVEAIALRHVLSALEAAQRALK